VVAGRDPAAGVVKPAVRNRRLLRSGLAVLALPPCPAPRLPGSALVSPESGSPLALSSAGVLSGAARAGAAAAPPAGRWPVTVAVTDTRSASATAALSLSVAESPAPGVNRNLRYAEWAWRYPNDDG
jgi:hypothetical protein